MPENYQKRPKWSAYEIEEELMADLNFREIFEEYQASPLSRKLGKLQ